jgi:peptidoglycan/xylan/chitin deacetylase (PgdA/CDA1 family)
MYVCSDTLDKHIYYLNHYFEIQSFANLSLSNHKYSSKPTCILTFDDGWRDFYDHAFPILKKHSVPATIFLPTGYIGTHRLFWTDRLGHALQSLENNPTSCNHDNRNTVENLVYSITHKKGSFSGKLEQSISLLKQYPSDTIENVLSYLESLAGDNTGGERAFLSWDEVRDLKESGLVSFGSHTVNHSILTNIENDKEVEKELTDSKSELIRQGAVGENEPIPFCYPNGNYNQAIKEKVSKVYNWACTTKSGMNGPDSDPCTLRRIALHEDMSQTKGLLGCRILEIL